MKNSIKKFLISCIFMFPMYGGWVHADVVWIKPDDGARITVQGDGYYDDTNATITVERNYHNGINVLFPSGDQLTNKIELSAPDSLDIAVGEYTGLQRFPFEEPGHPGFEIFGFSWCEADESSSFIVHEVAYLPDGSVDSLALDAIIYCTNHLRKTEINIRINSSVPIGPVGPIADAGQDQVVLPGSNVTLDAGASYSTDAVSFSYQWQQIEGPTVALSNSAQAAPTFTAPSLASSYEFLRFRVTITDTLDRQSSDTVTVTVSSNLQAQTQLVLRTNTNDWLGRVEEQIYTPMDYPWRTVRSEYNGIKVVADCTNAPPSCSPYTLSPRFNLWNADYSDPVIGSSDASYPLASFVTDADLTFLTDYCRVTHYHILDVAYEPNGAVKRLAVNFYSDCQDGLQGFIRYNSVLPLVPNHPLVSAGRDRLYFSGETVMLDGRNTWDANLPSAQYSWQQISGPAVALTSSDQLVTSFIAPNIPQGGADLEFELTVTNDQDQQRSDRVLVRIFGDQDPVTYAYVYQIPTDYDARWYITENETYITARQSWSVTDGNLLTVSYDPPIDGYSILNLSYFRRPGGAEIVPGTYHVENPTSTDSSGGLIDTYPSSVCDAERGQFIVHEIETDADDQVTRLAIDFSHTCNHFRDGERRINGVIRINSIVPRNFSAPVADPGSLITGFVGNTILLDGSGSWNLGGVIASYQWQQVSGSPVILNSADTMYASFVAPDVTVGEETLVFQLTVTDALGNINTHDVTVNIVPNNTVQTAAWIEQHNQTTVIIADDIYTSIRAQETMYVGEQSNVEISIGFDRFTLKAPRYELLTTGVYDDALVYGSELDYTRPWFGNNFLQPDVCFGEVRRKFIVYEIVYNPSNEQIDALAFNYQLFCESQTKPFSQGGVRINSSIPMVNPIPHASAGKDLVAEVGENVILDAKSSGDLDGEIVSYQWEQLSGTPVMLNDGAMMQAQFIAPQITASEGTLQFRVTVTDDDGNSQSNEMSVRVVTPQDPRQIVRLYVGDNENPNIYSPAYEYDENNSHMRAGRFEENHSIYVSASTNVTIGLNPSGLGLLTTGIFDIGVDNFIGDPWLGVVIDGRDCADPGGQFNVLEVEYGVGGQLAKLAVDFEKYCNYEDRVIRGSVRFNSALPVEAIELPIANAGPDITAEINDNIILDGGSSQSATADIVSYFWELVGYNSSISGELSSLDQAVAEYIPTSWNSLDSFTLTFKLTVVNSQGYSDTDTVDVVIINDTSTADNIESNIISGVTDSTSSENNKGGGGAFDLLFLILVITIFSRRKIYFLNRPQNLSCQCGR